MGIFCSLFVLVKELDKMASHFRTCKVLSQLVQKQASRALMINRGRMFLSTSAAKRGGGYSGYNDNHGGELEDLPIKTYIGTREVVGYGMNGEEIYIDNVHYPFPSIRFKEDTPEIVKLKEKEKGDWKKMTAAEKKELYRASFCQTLTERGAPTGDWKAILGGALIRISVALWGFIWVSKFAYGDLPKSFEDEHLRVVIQRMIDMRAGPIEGFASNYDYEKNQFKKMPW